MALLEDMSHGLMLPLPLLQGIVRKASHSYKRYEIDKRQGGKREIHHPSKELKALQRWLNHNVIAKWPMHDAAYAYRRGRSIGDHARRHAASAFLLRLDLKNFFPSITAADVASFLRRDLAPQRSWRDEDRDMFVEIVCRFGRLTIGAPSSPALSNALCFDLDFQLAALSEETDLTYTRYADDLFFSTHRRGVLGEVPERVSGILRGLELPAGLQLRADKTRHSSKKGRRQVTGLVLGSDSEVHLGRNRKRFIRRQIFRWESLSRDEQRTTAGLVAFAMSIEPDFINALVLKYGQERIAAVRDAI